MALVGDPIIGARLLAVDKPKTLPAPSGVVFAVFVQGFTNPPAGTYFIKVTQFTAWGESLPSTESAGLVVGANNGIHITLTPDPAATKIAFYWGLTSGAQTQRYEISGPWAGGSQTFTLLSGGTNVTGVSVPTYNTAYLPDTDGPFVSASTAFTWLNDGLKKAIRIANGIRDITGCPSVLGQPMYLMTGQWQRLTQGWFDGYSMDVINRRNYFYRNTTSALSWATAVTYQANQVVLEVYPQPNRTAGSTTSTGTISALATSVPLTSASSFVLPFGLAMIGTEIVSYSSLSGNTMSGMFRGFSGTTPASWAAGTIVQELNLRYAGTRLFGQTYSPGQGSLTLPVPEGWESAISTFILHKFREVEQDGQESARLLTEFEETMKGMKVNYYAGPVQIGASLNREVYGGGVGGGWLVP